MRMRDRLVRLIPGYGYTQSSSWMAPMINEVLQCVWPNNTTKVEEMDHRKAVSIPPSFIPSTEWELKHQDSVAMLFPRHLVAGQRHRQWFAWTEHSDAVRRLPVIVLNQTQSGVQDWFLVPAVVHSSRWRGMRRAVLTRMFMKLPRMGFE